MSQSRNPVYKRILNAQDSTGVGSGMRVEDYRNISVVIAGNNSADLTVKCQGAIAKNADLSGIVTELAEPAWGTAASVTNAWDYVNIYDLEDNAKVDGDTGVVFNGTDAVRNFIINVDNLSFINFEVTARSAGDVTVVAMAVNNE